MSSTNRQSNTRNQVPSSRTRDSRHELIASRLVHSFIHDEDPGYHLTNLHDMFIHFLMDREGARFTKAYIARMHHTFQSVRDLITDMAKIEKVS